jgi:hypothetical protein
MSTDQVELTRNTLEKMMNVANAAVDRHARGPTDSVEGVRRFLQHTNDLVNEAIDRQTRR